MSTWTRAEAVENTTRISRNIVAALAGGLLLFMALQPFIDPPEKPGEEGEADQPVVTVVMAVLGVAGIVASFIVPEINVKNELKRLAAQSLKEPAAAASGQEPEDSSSGDVRALLGLFQTKTIIGAALLEGAGFAGVVGYMIERNMPLLGVAVVAVAILLGRLPSVDSVQSWLDEQLTRLARMRAGID